MNSRSTGHPCEQREPLGLWHKRQTGDSSPAGLACAPPLHESSQVAECDGDVGSQRTHGDVMGTWGAREPPEMSALLSTALFPPPKHPLLAAPDPNKPCHALVGAFRGPNEETTSGHACSPISLGRLSASHCCQRDGHSEGKTWSPENRKPAPCRALHTVLPTRGCQPTHLVQLSGLPSLGGEGQVRKLTGTPDPALAHSHPDSGGDREDSTQRSPPPGLQGTRWEEGTQLQGYF